MTLVKENFPPEFHVPVLIALLSTRLYHFEYDSVEEMFDMIAGECPEPSRPW